MGAIPARTGRWTCGMKVHKWKDIRERKLSPEQLQWTDEQVGQELLGNGPPIKTGQSAQRPDRAPR